MASQKGFAHLILVLIVLAVVVVVGFLLLNKNKQLSSLTKNKTQGSAVQLKADYKNPFDKKDQFVNPFDQYKSPLQNLKNE